MADVSGALLWSKAQQMWPRGQGYALLVGGDWNCVAGGRDVLAHTNPGKALRTRNSAYKGALRAMHTQLKLWDPYRVRHREGRTITHPVCSPQPA